MNKGPGFTPGPYFGLLRDGIGAGSYRGGVKLMHSCGIQLPFW
jgi:hypothetical protein